MHSDDSPPSTPSGSPPPDPALEARLVAWIAGEASPFEAAELARLCAENPELEKFRRRVAAVHGLVAEAVRPAPTGFRLAPERRAKLLAALDQTASPAALGGSSTLAAPATIFPAARRWTAWALPAAACLALLGLLAAIVIPTVEHTFGIARDTPRPFAAELALQAPESQPLDVVDSATRSSSSSNAAETPAAFGGQKNSLRDGDAQVYFNRANATTGSGGASFSPAAPAPAVTTAPTSGGFADARRLEAVAAETRRRRSLRDESKEKSERADLTVTLETQMDSDYVFRGSPPSASSSLGLRNEFAGPSEAPTTAVDAFPSGGIKVVGRESSPQETFGLTGDASTVDALKAQGRTQYASGAIDDAQETFRTAKALASADTEAGYFLDRIAEDKTRVATAQREATRFSQIEEIAKGWQRPGGSIEDTVQQKADAAKPAPRPAPDASLRLETSSAENAVSTFSLHVSDASFRLARAALARGEFPDAASVRPEEFYNAFDYGDPAPLAGEPVAARVEQAAHPFLQQRNLLRVALRVPAVGRAADQPLRLVLLLDTSGSMEREDRAAIIRAALEQLAALLGPADRVTLVGFARTPRLLADRVPGDQAASLVATIAATPSEGGTNLDEALKLAAELALRQFDPASQNRVVLLTDGAANLGDADPAALSSRIVDLRRKGVAFDACGVGANGLDDGILESLTRQGDGRYLLLNTPDEADSAFARQLAGAFRPAAQNVKVQVRFNPARVPRYRLIGFEQHRLREQDFRDDRVDAAELAAEEAAVALYQVEVDPQGEGELGEIFVRFRETSTGHMVERSWPLPYEPQASPFDRASPSLHLAGASALLAEKLRGGDPAAQIRLTDLDSVAAGLRAHYAGQPRVAEFLEMLAQARRLAPE